MKEEFKTLDDLWNENEGNIFSVVYQGDVFKRVRKVTGKTKEDNKLYDPNLYWVDGRLICREDSLKKKWKQVCED